MRRIDEVTRGVTARDQYEMISRNVRYELYRQAISECVNNGLIVKSCGVFLGENSFTDMYKDVFKINHRPYLFCKVIIGAI